MAPDPSAPAPPRPRLMRPRPARLTGLRGYAWAAAGVGSATALFWLLRAHLDPWQASLLYLPVVIACAVRFGFGPAVSGALLSFVCWDFFFLPPVYHLAIHSRRDAVLLVVFLVAALTTAHLGSCARRQAREAEARERETALLHQASQAISREVASDRLLQTLVEQVIQMCRAPWCAVLSRRPLSDALVSDALVSDALVSDVLEVAAAASDAPGMAGMEAAGMEAAGDGAAGLSLPLEVEGRPVGLLRVGPRRDGTAFSRQDERLLLTLANHAAVIIARERLAEEAQQQARQAAVLEERNRLARDVHDALSHTFTGIKFLLEAADRVGPTAQAFECIAQARQMAVEGAQEARRSVWALRPTALEESGDLPTALRRVISQQTAGTALQAALSVEGAPQPLPPALEEGLLRICQEALTNVLRHAGAATVAVTLTFTPSCLTLAVADDGAGFQPDAAPSAGGFGLISIRQRSERIGAALTIQSRPRQGTRLEVRAPLRGE